MKKPQRHFIIANEGFPFVALCLLLSVMAFIFLPSLPLIGLTLSFISVFVLWFFRNPHRDVTADRWDLLAPADGKIITIAETEEPYFSKKKVLKISIFMSVFDVHVNRSPVSGVVTKSIYNPGKFFPAMKEKASLHNEQFAFEITPYPKTNNRKEDPIVVVQIAGLVARRIVHYLETGDTTQQGERVGIIRFGSRVDLYVPIGTKIYPSLGDRTVAGKTIIGRLSGHD